MAEPRRVRTARALHEGLTSDDARVRLQTLAAVAARPDAALALGWHDGRDVVAVLAERATTAKPAERLACLRVLALFADARVRAVLVEVLTSSDVPDALFLAAEYVARGPVDDLRPLLTRLLLQDESPPRARAAAAALRDPAGLDVAGRLRLSLAAMDGPAPPPLDATTAARWLSELEGPFRVEARSLAEEGGEAALRLVADAWARLSDETREWLVLWGMDECPHLVEAWAQSSG
jgi:hypothetical protein